MRTIKYHFDRDTHDEAILATSEAEVRRALGYLTTWALPGKLCGEDSGYHEVNVFIMDHGKEIAAGYNDDYGNRYEIHGIWDAAEGRFGFHS